MQDTLRMAEDSLAQVSDLLQMIERAKEVSGSEAPGESAMVWGRLLVARGARQD